MGDDHYGDLSYKVAVWLLFLASLVITPVMVVGSAIAALPFKGERLPEDYAELSTLLSGTTVVSAGIAVGIWVLCSRIWLRGRFVTGGILAVGASGIALIAAIFLMSSIQSATPAEAQPEPPSAPVISEHDRSELDAATRSDLEALVPEVEARLQPIADGTIELSEATVRSALDFVGGWADVRYEHPDEREWVQFGILVDDGCIIGTVADGYAGAKVDGISVDGGCIGPP